jgi:signal transduction histidine kinase
MVSQIDTIPDTRKLQNNVLFAGIPVELIQTIGLDIDLFRFDRGDVVFNEGEPGDCMYLVVEGSVRISKLGRGGKQEALSVIQPGNFFGEMALIDGQPRSASATAAESTILGCINAASFARILESSSHDLHMNFLRSVVERLRGVNSHFISELMRSERLSLVGSMANTIIHDLKTPIQILISCTEFIAMRTKNPEISEFTGIMHKAIDNMTDMVQELLDFARGDSSLEFKRMPAHAVITEMESQLIHLIPSHIHVLKAISICDEILVDVGRFTRVLTNIIKNSVEAMPAGGLLRIELRQEESRVKFVFKDTGCGIPRELQAKIFEPFVTYGKSKGTGLGMAIAKSVVEAHGGSIRLESEEGVGTTVEVFVPLYESNAPSANH